jgi:high-affinity K+ transport system ATPase subunit B
MVELGLGRAIPADGVVEAGEAMVNQAAIRDAARPSPLKSSGDWGAGGRPARRKVSPAIRILLASLP